MTNEELAQALEREARRLRLGCAPQCFITNDGALYFADDAADAEHAANEAIDAARSDAFCDGEWPIDVESIGWGLAVYVERATVIGLDEGVEYALQPLPVPDPDPLGRVLATITAAFAEGAALGIPIAAMLLATGARGGPIDSFCAICGPSVSIDEDGCCVHCGGAAVGDGADLAIAALRATGRRDGTLDSSQENGVVPAPPAKARTLEGPGQVAPPTVMCELCLESFEPDYDELVCLECQRDADQLAMRGGR